MTDALVEGGVLTANKDERTLTGLLLPYNEEGRTNLGKLTFPKGVVRIPRDPAVMTANIEHDATNPVGRAVAVEDTEAGVVVTFAVANTDEGDQLLADVAEGKLTKLSAEVKNVVIRAGKAISGALFGGAFVAEGAFPSAALMAADAGEIEETPEPTVEELTAQIADLNKRLTEALVVPAAETTDSNPEADTSDEDTNTEEENDMSVVPQTLAASAASETKEAGLTEVLSLIQGARSGDNTMLAALADIKTSGAGALPIAGVVQPAWLGELWQGRSYTRRFMPLIRNGSIRAIDEKGFVISGTEDLVKAWAGNKTELPTGTATTALKSSTFQRWGYAADIAREFFDIPGNEEVINAFLSKLANSYARVTDDWTRAQLVASATRVDPETYPSGYVASMGQLIQGIEAVEDAGDTASFAIANAAAWTELLYTPKDQVPEFVSFAFGTNFEGVADGKIRVVKGDVGIDDSPAILVGSAAAAHVNELPGASPLQLEALDIARGGVDRAVIGYTQFLADFPEALVLVGDADA